MRILETLLVGLVVTSSDLLFEAWAHKQPMSLVTNFSIGQDKDSAKTASSHSSKVGYVGFVLTNNVIGQVFEGSPADKAGITTGDKIMDINDKSIFGLDANGLADQLIGPAGTDVQLIVEHGEALRKLRLIRAQAVPAEGLIVVAQAKQATLVENWAR
jgi:C-terminal processing protease CtpA/Prc